MNKSAILMILPCVIAVAIVVVEGQLMTSGVGYSGLGGYGSYGSYGAAGVSRQQYQQRYLQEFLKARQQRNQLNALAKQSTFANFVNYSKSNWTHLKNNFLFVYVTAFYSGEISNRLSFYFPLTYPFSIPVPLVLLLTTLTNNTALPMIG